MGVLDIIMAALLTSPTWDSGKLKPLGHPARFLISPQG
jgi:hypothetical protein